MGMERSRLPRWCDEVDDSKLAAAEELARVLAPDGYIDLAINLTIPKWPRGEAAEARFGAMRRMYEAGWSTRQIAAWYGIAQFRVVRIFQTRGFECRSLGNPRHGPDGRFARSAS